MPARPDLQDSRGKARAMPSWYPSRKPASKALLKAHPVQAGVLNFCWSWAADAMPDARQAHDPTKVSSPRKRPDSDVASVASATIQMPTHHEQTRCERHEKGPCHGHVARTARYVPCCALPRNSAKYVAKGSTYSESCTVMTSAMRFDLSGLHGLLNF